MVGPAHTSRSAIWARLFELARHVAPYPVKMIWSREEDFAQGLFRPHLATRLRGALGPDGKPSAWSQIYVDGVVSRVESFHVLYLIPNVSIRSVASSSHVHIGYWRSVNHSQHAFWTESFIDALAHAAGRDPFEYRRNLLPPGSRERTVLETVAEHAGWGSALQAGVGRGIAIAESHGSFVAEFIEASSVPTALRAFIVWSPLSIAGTSAILTPRPNKSKERSSWA